MISDGTIDCKRAEECSTLFYKVRELEMSGFFLSSNEISYQNYLDTASLRKRCFEQAQRMVQKEDVPTGDVLELCSIVKEELSKMINSSLDSIPVSVSKKGLYPWEPACCWIEEWEAKESSSSVLLIPRIQLSSSLKKESFASPLFLKIGPSPEAIIAHEYIHALRAHFLSHQYEEYMAYWFCRFFSRNTLDLIRFYFGPLFAGAREVVLWSLLVIASTMALPFLESYEGILILVSLLLFLPLIRLIFRWMRFSSAVRSLLSVFEEKYIHAVLVRLEDSEINTFASLKERKDVLSYIHQRTDNGDLKFCYIKEMFLKNENEIR